MACFFIILAVKIELLNVYRGIAILMVFIHHVLAYTEIDSGSLFHAGVAIFFVISGFCIHLSFLRNPTWSSFFHKRFFRIYPPYFCVLLLFIVIDETKSLTQIGTHALLIHNVSERTFFDINASFWSIAIEVQLYLIYPLLVILVRNFGWRNSLMAIGLLELSIRILSSITTMPFVITFSPFAFWFSWSIGAYLADRYERKQKLLFRWYLLAACVIATIVIHYADPYLFFPLVAMSTFMILSNQIFTGFKFRETPLTKYLSTIGVISYSFYLLHQPLLGLWLQLAGLLTGVSWLLFLASVPCWVIIHVLSNCAYNYIEIPSINLGRFIKEQNI